MPFWKKMYNKQQGVYYPRAIVQGKPVETPRAAVRMATIRWDNMSHPLDGMV